jgi:hypothetical protein
VAGGELLLENKDFTVYLHSVRYAEDPEHGQVVAFLTNVMLLVEVQTGVDMKNIGMSIW